MFEESLFDQQPVEPVKEGEFLYNYEIKSWESLPWVPKILGASAILNIVTILLVGQATFLTAKGCDSPLVSRVCQVLDTVAISAQLFGTDREYVDQVYDKIDLADADVTFVDVSGAEPQFEYPEGYFQLANPEQAMMTNDMMLNPSSGFPNFPTYTPSPAIPSSPDLSTVKPVLPKANPNPVSGELPGGFGDVNTPTPRKGRGGKITVGNSNSDTASKNANNANNPTVANAAPVPTPMDSDAVKAVQVNKKPLTDFADSVVAKWAAKQIDLSQQFTVSMDGYLTPDGKLDPKKSRWDTTKEKGDQKMKDIAKEALEAVGESGFLTYLKSLDVDKFNITLVQDENQVMAVITSSQKNPERAKAVSSGLNTYISIGKTTAKDPSDELTLLNGASVTADGNNFVLNFAIPKPVAQEMINRKLQEAQAKQQQQPSGNATVKTTPNSAR